MSKKQWLVLLMLFLAYLLLGASIFYHIESRLEIENVRRAKEERIEINALLHKHYVMHNQHEILEKLTQYCGKSVYNYTEGETDPLKWDFYNSFYFAYTVVSTIGYGNLAPTNMLGRILMIFYGLVGIPMNGILLTQLGEFFGHAFVRAHRKYKSYKQEQSRDYCPKKLTSLETRKAGLAVQIFIYLTPGFLMFIFFPAFLFSHYEGWSYDEAVYYAFVTLTTIGFGDYVAGQDNSKGSGIFFIMYKTFLICWISFGLGYIVMIMTFIARGMRSKKITRIEHKLAMNLKHTQSKIWNEFNKEVNYLRRVFNELQLSKVKRVYVNEADYEEPPAKFPRSNSFPDLRDLLYGGLNSPSPPPRPRRRANSEVVPTEDQLTRVVSETDLQRIDKTATFAAHAMVQPAELLARLVNILGYIPPMPPPDDLSESPDWDRDQIEQTLDQDLKDAEMRGKAGGIDGFGEKEILASELTWNGPTWKLESDGLPVYPKPRSRAVSEVRLQDTKNQASLNQRTWSGPMASKKIQELIKTRRSGLSAIKDGKSYKFPSLSLPKSVPKTLFPRWRRQSTNKKAGPDAFEVSASSKCFGISRGTFVGNVGNLETKENYSSQNETINATSANAGQFTFNSENGADPVAFSRRLYLTHTGANPTNLLEGSNLLEETSLADFLRAIAALRSRVGTVPDDYSVRKPQRKMGTACLTPPKLPSLFTLFSSPPAAAAGLPNCCGSVSAGHSQQNTVAQLPAQARRFSLWNADGNVRRGSAIPSVAPRRFSLRPVGTPIGGTPPNYGSPRSTRQRQRSILDDNSQRPTDSFFSLDSSREPLVRMEGAPGISSPVVSSTNLRRFSLRPAQIGVPPAPANPKGSAPGVQPTKALPRWRAGMLQRQIGRASLRRRARAFSLSDVNTEESLNPPGISPLAMDGTMVVGRREFSVRIGRPSTSSVQKTVTIVQPPDSSSYKSSENRNQLSDLCSTADSPGNPSITIRMDHNPFATSMDFDGTPSAAESTILRSHLSTGISTSVDRTCECLSTSGNEGGDGPQLLEYKMERPMMVDLDSPRETRTPPVSDKLTHYPKRDQVASEVKPFAIDLLKISIADETSSPRTSNEAVNVELKRSLQYREDTVIGIDDESIDRNIEGSDSGRKSLKIPKIFQPPPPNHGRSPKDEEKNSPVEGPGELLHRVASGKVSSTSGGASTSSSRKSSSTRISPPRLKPRVFVNTYKPTLEAKIEKPILDPFEQYRASTMSRNDQAAPMEVKIEQRQRISKRELSKSSGADN